MYKEIIFYTQVKTVEDRIVTGENRASPASHHSCRLQKHLQYGIAVTVDMKFQLPTYCCFYALQSSLIQLHSG